MRIINYVYKVNTDKNYVCPHCHGFVSYISDYYNQDMDWRCEGCTKKIDEESLTLEIGEEDGR